MIQQMKLRKGPSDRFLAPLYVWKAPSNDRTPIAEKIDVGLFLIE